MILTLGWYLFCEAEDGETTADETVCRRKRSWNIV